jgi:mono/diheme cytochrome c family protein
VKLVQTLCLAGLLPASLVFVSSQAAAQQSAAAVYKQRCAGCHGPDGSGQTAMGRSFKLRAFSSPEVQQMTDTQLYDVIAKGKGKMPGYEKSLGSATVKELVAYVRVLGKPKH